MRVITYEDKKEINRLYKELGTYAAFSRKMGISPSTVKKYVIDGFEEVEEDKIERFDRPLPEFDPSIFRVKNWNKLCELTDEEVAQVMKIWEEILV